MFKKGFSLVEIIVAMLLLSVIMVGLAGVFVAGKRHIIHSRERISSLELGKLFIDPLQDQVRQDTWDQSGNGLNIASSLASPGSPQTINKTEFSSTYTTTAVVTTDLRRVTTTVHWVEPSI